MKMRRVRKRNSGRAGIKVIERRERFAKPASETDELCFARKKRLKFRSRPWNKASIVISDSTTTREILDYWCDTGRYEWPNGETGSLQPNDLLGALKLANAALRAGSARLQPRLPIAPRGASANRQSSKASASQIEKRPLRPLSLPDREALSRLRGGKSVVFETRHGAIKAQVTNELTGEVHFRTSSGFLVFQAWFDGSGVYVPQGQDFCEHSGPMWQFCRERVPIELDRPVCRLGAKVWIKNLDSGVLSRYHIVESVAGRSTGSAVTVRSAIGQALSGRKAGDAIKLNSSGTCCSYEVTRVALPGTTDYLEG